MDRVTLNPQLVLMIRVASRFCFWKDQSVVDKQYSGTVDNAIHSFHFFDQDIGLFCLNDGATEAVCQGRTTLCGGFTLCGGSTLCGESALYGTYGPYGPYGTYPYSKQS